MKRIALLLAFFSAPISLLQAADMRPIVPVAAVSLPIGETGDSWENGFSFGVQFPLRNSRHGDWSVIASYQQMKPNAEEMLRTGGRDMKIEQSEGVSRIAELGVMGERNLLHFKSDYRLDVTYGAGVYFVGDEKIHIKGSYTTPTTALTREIYRSAEQLVVPGLTVGVSVDIRSKANLVVRYQHLLTAEKSRTFVIAGIGFFPY